MKKSNKIYIAAAVCIGAGIILTAGGIMAGGKPGVALSSDGIRMLGDAQKEDYVLEKTELEAFSSVEMNLDYANFKLIPSDGYYLEYCLGGNSQKPKYEVKNGKFVFEEKPVVNYVQFQIMSFGISEYYGQYCVNLYVPEDVYFDTFVLNNSSGDAEIGDLKGKSIELYLGYGKLSADSIEGNTVELTLESGNLEAEKVSAGESLEITMSYGDLNAETLKSADLAIRNSAGNIKTEGLYADMKGDINLDYGNLQMTDCRAGELKMTLGSGDLRAENLTAKTLEIFDSYGGMKAENLTVTDTGSITMDSGSLTLGTCKTGDMKMNLSDGNMKVLSMNGDNLTVENSNGNVEIDELILEKKGTLILDYGNAEVALGDDISGYTMKLDTEYGNIKVPEVGRLTSDNDEESFRLEGTREKELEIRSSSGDIAVTALKTE